MNRYEHPFYRHKILSLSQEKIVYSNKTNYLCYGKRIKQLQGDRGEHSGESEAGTGGTILTGAGGGRSQTTRVDRTSQGSR